MSKTIQGESNDPLSRNHPGSNPIAGYTRTDPWSLDSEPQRARQEPGIEIGEDSGQSTVQSSNHRDSDSGDMLSLLPGRDGIPVCADGDRNAEGHADEVSQEQGALECPALPMGEATGCLTEQSAKIGRSNVGLWDTESTGVA